MKFLFRYTLALLLTARSLAGELTEPESDHTYTTTIDGRQLSSFGQRIIFEEPMADVHRQGRNCILSSEQANKMYRITGDGPTPLLQWESASEALIYYRQGTAPNTRYRLSFHEGSRQYLSGRTMKNPEIEFCAPPCRLTITDESNRVLIEGSEREGVLLEVNEDLYKTIEIPPQSLEFTFLRKERGETIRGIAEPARIKDLRPLALREAYKDAPRDILAALHPGVQYLELTDYLPSCMKTEDEHYEKQGHCLRRQMEIPGSDVVTVQYHARVMFSGTSTAPAAYAAFMHAPQIYGSSASQDITTKR